MSEGEYTGSAVRVRSGKSRRRADGGGRSLRLLYFGGAALWGFTVGVAGMGAAAQTGMPGLPVLLIGGAGVALAGGAVAASAYREARKRISS
jgi:hypothetical protein